MSILPRTRVAALAALLALAGCEAPVAGPTELAEPTFARSPAFDQTVTVMWHAQQQLIGFGGTGQSGPVEGAWARLVRNRNGIAYQIHAAGLTPGHAYSLWLVVINNPAACAATPCSAADILLNPNTDSQVLAGGTGTVAGRAGKGTLAGSARTGPLAGWLEGRSLHDAYSAEVHLVINDHGPMLPAFMPDMIKTYRAGCSDASPFPGVFPATALADGAPGPNTCLLFQAAVFPVP